MYGKDEYHETRARELIAKAEAMLEGEDEATLDVLRRIVKPQPLPTTLANADLIRQQNIAAGQPLADPFRGRRTTLAGLLGL